MVIRPGIILHDLTNQAFYLGIDFNNINDNHSPLLKMRTWITN